MKLILITVMATTFTGPQPARPQPHPLAAPLVGQIRERMTPQCSKPLACGDVGFVDCGRAEDLPAYFFSIPDGRILGFCGGYCQTNFDHHCETDCPPAQWKCAPL